MLPGLMLNAAMLSMALVAAPDSGALKAEVVKVFEASCTSCHDAADDLINLAVNPETLVGKPAKNLKGKILIVAGNPAESYLLTKMTGDGPIDGEVMPAGEGRLPGDKIAAVSNWITSLAAPAATASASAGAAVPSVAPAQPSGPRPPTRGRIERPKPFHGTHQIVLPTTTTLGQGILQFRIDHRFGRIGTERGFLGLDAGVIMSIGLAVGLVDGWDFRIRRTNSLKGWEIGTRYIPLRQEKGRKVSFGFEASLDGLRDEGAANPVSGNIVMMLSRLWFQRWSTMLTLSYSSPTNHAANPEIDYDGDGEGPVPVEDRRGTLDVGIASTVWLGKARRWGLEIEYLQPIPAPADPTDIFYYRGGDADSSVPVPIGSWSIGGSYYTGKHFFQVFITNNRQIHLNQAAPGGQVVNPFQTEGLEDPPSALNQLNFFLGFNLARHFTLGKNAARWRKEREEKLNKQGGGATANARMTQPASRL